MPKKKILCIFAHPDDETFGMGGTIAKYSSSADFYLITATLGEEGMTSGLAEKENLGGLRKKELSEAAGVLGIKEIGFLGLRDGSLAQEEEKLKEVLTEKLNQIKPNIVITFEKSGITGHSDHKVISKASTAAFNLASKELKELEKLYWLCVPESFFSEESLMGEVEKIKDNEVTTMVDISSPLSLKIEAAKKYLSQRKDLDSFLSRVRKGGEDKEFFIRVFPEDKVEEESIL